MKDDPVKQEVESAPDDFDELAEARPEDDALEMQWVRARAAAALFSNALDSPPSVGRFELGDRLGAGGMGVVYAAHDPELDREVAVKLVRVNADEERERVYGEAQALARVTHPNVVAIHDVGILDDQVYLVMEFVGGATLRAYAKGEGRSRYEIVDAYRQAADGLAAAHAEGLVHRDFKPDNAIIGDDGRVRVIDFGLAHTEEEVAARPTAGTPKYMAPEQARGETLTSAADQFALCASLREALSNVDGDELPGWLDEITSRGTAEDPGDRFADVAALTEALSRDPRQVWKRRAALGGVAATVAVAFAVGSTVFAGGSTVDACAGGPELIEASWGEAPRSAALAKISAAGDYAARLAPLLENQFSAFSDRWAKIHRDVCLVHKRGESSPGLLDQQMVCLDRAKRAYAATGGVVENAASADVANLAVLAQSLPDPDSCSDITALSSVDPPQPEVAAEVGELSKRFAEIDVAIHAGLYERALVSIKELALRAEATGYGPVQAELKLLEGRAHIARWSLEQAIEPLRAATALALASGDTGLAIEAWARRAWAEGRSTGKTSATEGLDLIVAMTRGFGQDTFETGLLYNNLGSLEISWGDRKKARVALDKAVEISSIIEDPRAFELVNARSSLAIVTEDQDLREELSRAVVLDLSERLGADHPDTFDAIIGGAMLVSSPDKGRSLLEPTCGPLSTLHPSFVESIEACFVELAWFAEEGGDREAAADAMTRGAKVANDESILAFAAVLRGERKQAREQLLTLLAKSELSDDALWWEVLRRAELEACLGLSMRVSAPAEANEAMALAISRLEGIKDPLPVVTRRLTITRRWLAD